MANADKPMGAVPVGHLNGSPWNGKFRMYYVPSTDSTAIFIGDFVKSAGSADATGKYPTVAQAAAGDAIRGVVIGFASQPQVAFDVTDLGRAYRPASTAMYAAVVDDPDVIFEVQEDSDAGAIAATAIGNNADVVVGSGDTTTGLSAMELDSSDVATSTAQLRILGVVDREDNELGTNAKLLVLINEHELKSTTGA
ncbi:MAG: hypothetical protein GY845_30400 [Planctomycetes bacterium]|nr:hypothetical protein [Planctomycetota bacterium]